MINLLNPSILSADFGNLERDILELEKNGISKIHIDVMDGSFVPNLTFGPSQISCLRGKTNLVFDCHLMVNEPIRFVDDFVKSGVDFLGVHVEACTHIHRTLDYIKSKGVKPYVVLNPGTPLSSIEEVLSLVDKVLIMSVNPGFGGQKFIYESIDKIKRLKAILKERDYKDIVIQIDGGINSTNINEVYKAGADDIVVGSFIFNGVIKENIEKLVNKLG